MLSFVVAGITCVFAALCYAEFASMVPVAGSAYTYAYATLGELFAWIIGWDLVLEYAVGLVDRGARLVALLPGVPRNSSASSFPHIVSNAPFDFDPTSGQLVAHRHRARPSGRHHRPARHRHPGQGHQGERRRSTPAMVVVKVAVVLFVIVVGAFYVKPENWTRSRRSA